MKNIDIFREIEFEKPVDKIIDQIRSLIISGRLKPGDKLPSERQLSERIGLGRTYVRDAIKKLEFYGILKTHPQSGTVVAGIGISALEGLITNILKIEKSDFASLVETRVILEIEAAKLAAQHRTAENIELLEEALEKYNEVSKKNIASVGEDFMFHLKIVEASQNQVIKSLLMIIVPEIMENYRSMNVCTSATINKAYIEHRQVLDAIKAGNPEEAGQAMRIHLQKILKFSKSLR